MHVKESLSRLIQALTLLEYLLQAKTKFGVLRSQDNEFLIKCIEVTVLGKNKPNS